MSENNKHISTMTECPICFNRYSSPSGPNSPRLLPSCGHTFCSRCLNSLLKTNYQGHRVCPTCRKPISENTFPVNIVAQQLAETLCASCDKNSVRNCEGHCVQMLCEECFQAHRRSHELMTRAKAALQVAQTRKDKSKELVAQVNGLLQGYCRAVEQRIAKLTVVVNSQGDDSVLEGQVSDEEEAALQKTEELLTSFVGAKLPQWVTPVQANNTCIVVDVLPAGEHGGAPALWTDSTGALTCIVRCAGRATDSDGTLRLERWMKVDKHWKQDHFNLKLERKERPDQVFIRPASPQSGVLFTRYYPCNDREQLRSYYTVFTIDTLQITRNKLMPSDTGIPTHDHKDKDLWCTRQDNQLIICLSFPELSVKRSVRKRSLSRPWQVRISTNTLAVWDESTGENLSTDQVLLLNKANLATLCHIHLKPDSGFALLPCGTLLTASGSQQLKVWRQKEDQEDEEAVKLVEHHKVSAGQLLVQNSSEICLLEHHEHIFIMESLPNRQPVSIYNWDLLAKRLQSRETVKILPQDCKNSVSINEMHSRQ